MDLQHELDRVYSSLISGEINRKTYCRMITALADAHPTIASRFSYRRDQRSLGHFALALYDTTLRERFLLEQCWPFIAEEGETFEDLGVNNDGRLVLQARNADWNLDFLVRHDTGEYPLEIKYCPTQKFLTYKIDDLSKYLRTPRSKVLTVACPNAMVGANGDPNREVDLVLPDGSFFLLMDHDALERLIKIGEHGIHPGFGGKPTVRVYQRQFSQVCPVQSFEEEFASV